MIRDGEEIQRLAALHRLTHEVDDVAPREPIGGVGIDAHGAAQVGIQRIARMQVQVPEIRLAHRVDAYSRCFGGNGPRRDGSDRCNHQERRF